MRLKFILIIALCYLSSDIHAQLKDGINTNPSDFGIPQEASGGSMGDKLYRSPENKYYWKNRRPDLAYWQQDVQYNIYAKIHEEDDRIEGTEQLVYWNNSPDALEYVYFHLYQNAFINGSYLKALEMVNKVNSPMGKNEAAGLGITLDNIQVDGRDVKTELDNTIMKVYLPKPLQPGGKIVIRMNFNTYFDVGETRRRMKMWNAWGFMHYNGCQWYPKICVYDRMHGWDTYQHLNREFYGDYGVFDVMLDFPSNYVVEATGVLQNRQEVLPDSLRQKLDIKNFANKKWEEPPSIITPYEKGKRKVWHYTGNNVHDFAFTADPSYRIGSQDWYGVECVAIVQEPHAARWQNAPDYISRIIKTFSEDIGMYCYPKIVAADARDGMEYPMITMDGGADPGYRGLFIHEIGHNWFYGQVGSNETYRAAMDEGFTQFLTVLGLQRLEGDKLPAKASIWNYRKHFAARPVPVLDASLLNRYAFEGLNQVTNLPLNTHSDDFHSALGQGGGYGQVYFKTGSMLYNLQYTLGDSLFKAAMHHYFEQWKFAHPYFEDFRASIINFTQVDLSWFFDEWFETTKSLDYGITGIHKIKGTDSFAIRFKRKGEMQMPLDFTVTGKDGSKHDFYIPNTWFKKSTSATILPKWYGWGKLNTSYTAHVQIPGGIRNVQIDTSYRLGDKDLIDNYKGKGLCLNSKAIELKLDGGLNTAFDRRKYHLGIRPDLWWNNQDGIKAGVHFEGNYLQSLYNIDATIWWNTHLLQKSGYQVAGAGTYDFFSPFNYTFNYSSPLHRNMPKLVLSVNSRYLDGLWSHRGGFSWLTNDKNTIQLYARSMWRPNIWGLSYLTNANDWSSFEGATNTSLNASWTHQYSYFKGSGVYTFSLRAPMLTNAFNYSFAQLESINYNYLGRLEVRTRFIGRYGIGDRMPNESLLFTAGANPEEQMENKYTRSDAFIPDTWQGISQYDVNHFQQGGGLNLRGYAGYYAPDERSGTILAGYKGRSGIAANMEIGFENYMPWRPGFFRNWLHANVYAFGDAGVMELSHFTYPPLQITTPSSYLWSNVHVDAGLGLAFTIKKWGVFDKAKPLTLRVDFPVFLNRPPYSNTQYATFRYVVGINRAF